MHLLERRAAARRASDLDGARAQGASAANRRNTDRRVSAVRRSMNIRHLEAVHAMGVEVLVVREATYVFNGRCFAWLAEVQSEDGIGFLAGAGMLHDDETHPMARVVDSIREKVVEWEAVFREKACR